MIMQGSQTLGKTKKSKTAQRHSAGNIDYDNLPGSQESDDIPPQTQHGFRSRSKTVGDGKLWFHSIETQMCFLQNLIFNFFC